MNERALAASSQEGEGVNLSALQQRIVELERTEAVLKREIRMLRIANGELERVALRDSLTPLYNRRHFVNALNERIARLRRNPGTAAVIFADVDTMKSINDQFGHAAGDFALIHVARLLSEAVRTSDVVARIGGDEFAVILDDITESAAEAKMVELRQLMTEIECVYSGATVPVSASFGFTMVGGEDNDEAVMKRADRGMYAMKRANPVDRPQRSAR